MNNTTAYDTVKQFFDYYLTERNIDKYYLLFLMIFIALEQVKMK